MESTAEPSNQPCVVAPAYSERHAHISWPASRIMAHSSGKDSRECPGMNHVVVILYFSKSLSSLLTPTVPAKIPYAVSAVPHCATLPSPRTYPEIHRSWSLPLHTIRANQQRHQCRPRSKPEHLKGISCGNLQRRRRRPTFLYCGTHHVSLVDAFQDSMRGRSICGRGVCWLGRGIIAAVTLSSIDCYYAGVLIRVIRDKYSAAR